MIEVSVKRLNVEIIFGIAIVVEKEYERFKKKHPLVKIVDVQTHVVPSNIDNDYTYYSVFILWKDKIQVKERG